MDRLYKFALIVLTGIAHMFEAPAQKMQYLSNENNDTLLSQRIIFSPASASEYIKNTLQMEFLWKKESDSLMTSLSRLVDHYNHTYDSIKNRLWHINFRAAGFQKNYIRQNDTLNIRWLNDSTFFLDTMDLEKEPFFIQKTIVKKIIDSVSVVHYRVGDSIVRVRDTILSDFIIEEIIDTAYLESKKLKIHQVKNSVITPEINPAGSNRSYHFIRNRTKLILSTPKQVIIADNNSPFNIVPNEKFPDSLHIAIKTLLLYTDQRDSILLNFKNIEGKSTAFWLTSRDDELQRYWVKNYKNDSVSIWLGNADKKNITMILEDDIHLERIKAETADDVPFTMKLPNVQLVKTEALKEIPIYWDFDFSSSFSLSQNHLSNWAQGGESSLANLFDLKGQAKYSDKEAKREWTSNGRLKYGSILTKDNGLRKNIDLLELDSKYNKELRKKIDFSTLYFMKSQIAKGYNYPNDSVAISTFLNPATFTIGMGIEYKPVKKTSINFSVLSYKNTFVLDTNQFDQTIQGIDKDKRAKQEMGGQVLIKNELSVWDDLKINNSLRLFSNYLHKPGNVDFDWEFNLEKKISLYFTILLNIHMIYDDDIRFSILNENDEPVLLPDGSEKKVPKLQFKEFLGLTFLINL